MAIASRRAIDALRKLIGRLVKSFAPQMCAELEQGAATLLDWAQALLFRPNHLAPTFSPDRPWRSEWASVPIGVLSHLNRSIWAGHFQCRCTPGVTPQ
jgi:hypothetical protein